MSHSTRLAWMRPLCLVYHFVRVWVGGWVPRTTLRPPQDTYTVHVVLRHRCACLHAGEHAIVRDHPHQKHTYKTLSRSTGRPTSSGKSKASGATSKASGAHIQSNWGPNPKRGRVRLRTSRWCVQTPNTVPARPTGTPHAQAAKSVHVPRTARHD